MLARIYKTDKYGKHSYTKHYSTHLRKFRFKRIKLFEIGAGGYQNPDIGGNSLRMWKRYFPFGKIFSIDVFEKSQFEESRIKIFRGSQIYGGFLNDILDRIGEPDIIIDDGSHINEHVITTFELLFPRLKEGGIYIVEDTGTSYWPDYGGDSEDLNNPLTILNFFKSLTDCLNHQELINSYYIPTYYDKNIYSVQFYHNLIFVFKGLNNESSSVDFNNPDSVLVDKI
jgi:demethylmacrocin O-methyltransferase